MLKSVSAMTAALTLGAALAGCSGPDNAVAGKTAPDSPRSEAAATASATTARIQGGAESIDALIADFIQAVHDKDKARIRALRLTQDEYLNVIVPGSVQPGTPPPHYNAEEQEYIWGILNGKSVYTEASFIAAWGGKDLKVVDHEFRKATEKFPDYTAYRQLVLTVDDGSGSHEPFRLGSIAEVDGRFKFISYVRD